MNQKALSILEYDKVINQLAAQATCEEGQAFCRKLTPSGDPAWIDRAQTETSDALRRLRRSGSLSFAGAADPGEQIKRLSVGASLNAEELLALAGLLETAKRAKNWARDPLQEDLPADSLTEAFETLEPLTPLAKEIRRCILSPEEISDDASPRLHSIRRSMRLIGEKIHNEMNRMVNSASVRTSLQDAVITMRDGRYCLPVKASEKGQIPGMVHDTSATGSTLFIEPVAVVRLNNELKEAELQEQEEILAILANLSSQAAAHTGEIRENHRILIRLDFIFAKAKLAEVQDAFPPVLNTEGRINIQKGRHPLLPKQSAVPIDLRLGEDFHLLIVTGPNTGGKTVSLKTLGLLTLMGQSGLHIPAAEHSELAVFKQVWADIGDEQSIEQNLSTFSSHMTNIVRILKKANRGSLILFDELCAGTDPDEGAALAVSILDFLRRRQIRTMATTHYSELKLYALSAEGVENACCEFDVETLSPTYRLLIGIPGKSNAFAISGKLGLPQKLIDDARSRVSKEKESFEDVIAELEETRLSIRRQEEEIARRSAETEAAARRLEEKQEKLIQSRERILREANEEAAEILKEAKAVADETIRNFHKYGQGTASAATMERERENVRKKIDTARENAAKKQEPAKKKPQTAPESLHIGDRVRIVSMNLTGTVHSLPDAKGKLFVQTGVLRCQADLADLELLPEENPAAEYTAAKGSSGSKYNTGKSSGASNIKMEKSLGVSTEINLIGMTTDEALYELDKYLDDAYLAHLPGVRIVHGKGTGTLRRAVHNHLKKTSYIAEYHLGEFGEGDSGVTIATFT